MYDTSIRKNHFCQLHLWKARKTALFIILYNDVLSETITVLAAAISYQSHPHRLLSQDQWSVQQRAPQKAAEIYLT